MLTFLRNSLRLTVKSGHGTLHRPLSSELWGRLAFYNLLAPTRGQRGGNHFRCTYRRPITTVKPTATLSKFLEPFPAKWIMDAIYSKLDPKQFGSLKGYSAMDALISMFHCWYSNTDSNGKTILAKLSIE